jgi:hypothetical protein
MTVFVKSESLYGAPAGVYEARFLGVEPMRDDGTPRLGRDGKPMPPGVEWNFEIVAGQYTGRRVGRITSSTPTAKNACGTLLDGLLGRRVGVGERVEVSPHVGKMFQVVLGISPTNPERTQVVQIIRPQQASMPPAPPSPPETNSTASEEYFWSSYLGESKPAERLTRHVIQLDIDRMLVGPPAEQGRLTKLRIMRDGQPGAAWEEPSALGFRTKTPF